MKKNIARNRMVYHSSSYDKNLCGHLVTSGNSKDRWSERPYKFAEQYDDATESIWHIIDEQNITRWCSPHKSTYFDIVFKEPVKAKAYRLFSNQYDGSMSPIEWRLSGSNDGDNFVELDYRKYDVIQPWLYTYITDEPIPTIPAINSEEAFRIFRFEILNNNGSECGVSLGEFDLIGTDNKSLLRTFDGHFEQCWKSKGNREEYLLLDLGTVSDISEVTLEWGEEYAIDYEILASLDGEKWKSCYETNDGKGETECLEVEVKARYLKLLMHRSIGKHYVLREWRVMGENEPNSNQIQNNMVQPDLQEKDDRVYLKDGIWKIERASEVEASGNELASCVFSDEEWFPAVVPGTVLNSYMAAGAVCDYNNDENYTQHSDAFFTTNWWYRTHFKVDSSKKGKHIWLNFDAINWKADIYFNGELIGDIKGAFLRKKIDITELVKYDEENYLAVLIYCNNFPGPQKTLELNAPYFINGGVTGLDEPCLAAGIGWDWITTVSGRNIGIYKDVYVSYTDEIQIVDPWFETYKIDYNTNNARVAFRTEISNASSEMIIAKINCDIENGLYIFSKEVVLPAYQKCEVEVTDIIIRNARLWYPVGYGAPELYKAEITVSVNEIVSDKKTINFGIRRIDYSFDDGILSLSCNGRILCCVGGNWGMDDATERNNAKDYDIKIRLHADMNFNMIRNWVGQTNDEEFYNACDRHGVMIWDDFWLANPGDGPEPLDTDMFMMNAEDKLRKIRKHPSVVIYCGRNEGYPAEPLASLLPALVKKLDPNRLYIPHSAADPVSGYGPYQVLEKEYYFKNTCNTIHSERGIPNIPVLESVQKFLSPKNQWPINDTWVSHSFFYEGAQHCDAFCKRLRNLYGDYNSLEEFVCKSQMLCYETCKAIFEAERATEGSGMLLWMSSPAMPSFAFQTYDYYFAINGGYMGAKLANQPLHAYYNPINRNIILDNRCGRKVDGVFVKCQVFNIKGTAIWEISMVSDVCDVGQYMVAQLGEYKETVFLRTTVQTDEGQTYRNFEWIYQDTNGSIGLDLLEKANISIKINSKDKIITVENIGNMPALQINLSMINNRTKERILPVFWSDNFFSLMPGEEQEILYTIYDDITDKEMCCSVSGYNIDKVLVEAFHECI